MATFSIDNLLSKPFVSSDAEKDGLQKQSHLQVTPSSNPLSLSSSQELRVRPQMMYHQPTAAMFANPLSGIYDASGAPYASQSVMAAALEQYQAKRASSPAGSLADSWTEGDPEEERSSLERRKEDLEEERDDLTSAIGGDESDSDQADCSGKSDSKAQLEPRRMLIKDTNGQIKELIFPRGLDLDRPKRERTSFTPEQLFRLEKEFRHNQYMVGRDRGELATCLGLTETQVKVWFQNRRTKYKREKQREQENKKSDIDAMAACSMFKILEQSTGQYYTASGPRLFATPHPNNPNGASVVKSLHQLPSSSSQTPMHKIPGHPASAYMMPPNLISAQMNMHANKISPAQSTATSPGSNWPNLPHNPFLPSSLYWIGTPN